MQNEGLIFGLILVFGILVAIFLIAVLVKAQKRRKAQYADEPVPKFDAEDRYPKTKSKEPQAETENSIPRSDTSETDDSTQRTNLTKQREVQDQSSKISEPKSEFKSQKSEADAQEPIVNDQILTTKETISVDESLQKGLERTSSSFLNRFTTVFHKSTQIGPNALDELEEVLLTADIGINLSMRFIEALRDKIKNKGLQSEDNVLNDLKTQIIAVLNQCHKDPLTFLKNTLQPKVILFVGVNGVGKTTTIGKIAAKLKVDQHAVVLAAGDTFRAAAVEQLSIWGERADVPVIKGDKNADPASVIFNAVQSVTDAKQTVVLADTAGRLHTKKDLMDEITKIKKAASKARKGAPDEVWLVVDATTGQNALQQAKEFHQAINLTGIILTKLDGTAKGGIVVAIADTLKIPIYYVGVGEKIEDLRLFEPYQFVEALFQRG